MKDVINPQLRTELELERPPSSVWERLFRWGVFYLLVTTVIGTIAQAIFGEHKGPMPLWGWALVGPYLFFMLYCSNYAVARFVKSKLVKVAWWCLIGFIALVLTIVGVERLKANQAVEATAPRAFSFMRHGFYNTLVPGDAALPGAVPHLNRYAKAYITFSGGLTRAEDV